MFPPRPTPLGHAVLVLLRLVALFLALAAVGLLLTSSLLLVPEPPAIDPAGSGFALRFDPTTLNASLEGNLSLTVHGLYRVEDVRVHLRAVNGTGFPLADAAAGPFTLVPDLPHREPLVLPLNLGPWLRTAWPLTHDDNLTLTLALEGRYTTGLVRAALALTSLVPWEAPLRAWTVDVANSTFTPAGGNATWAVPYRLNSSGLLGGAATLAVAIANETATIAENTTALALGGPVAGTMNFTLTAAEAQELAATNHTLRVTLRVTLANGLTATVVETVAWTRRTA